MGYHREFVAVMFRYVMESMMPLPDVPGLDLMYTALIGKSKVTSSKVILRTQFTPPFGGTEPACASTEYQSSISVEHSQKHTRFVESRTYRHTKAKSNRAVPNEHVFTESSEEETSEERTALPTP